MLVFFPRSGGEGFPFPSYYPVLLQTTRQGETLTFLSKGRKRFYLVGVIGGVGPSRGPLGSAGAPSIPWGDVRPTDPTPPSQGAYSLEFIRLFLQCWGLGSSFLGSPVGITACVPGVGTRSSAIP